MRAADIRQILHGLSGAGAFLLYWLPGPAVAAVVAAGALTSVAAGRILYRRGAGYLYREAETPWRSGAITYAAGVVAAILLFAPEAAFIGWITLAVGDSASTLAGSRWPLRHFDAMRRRSLGGLMAFIAAAFVGVTAGTIWWRGSVDYTTFAGAFAVSVTCAAAESAAPGVDDNLFIPLLGAAVYGGVLWI